MNENQEELAVENNRVAHIPLGLFEEVVELGVPYDGDVHCDDESRVHRLFESLGREWVIIYRNHKEDDLRVRGFGDKELLAAFLSREYGREIGIDGVEMVLESGRPRRFQLEVRPKIGF